MVLSRSVATLAIDPVGDSSKDRLRAELFVTARDLRVSVVAEHAFVADFAPRVGLDRRVIPGIHSPRATAFGIPGERQFLESTGWGSMQIGADVVTRSHHKVDQLFIDIDLFPSGIDLPSPLIISALAMEHGKMRIGRLMVEILEGWAGYRNRERSAHPGSRIRGRDFGVADGAGFWVGVFVIAGISRETSRRADRSDHRDFHEHIVARQLASQA